jgi:ankyrin repeat protein
MAAVKRGDLREVERLVDRQPELLNSRLEGGISAVLLAIYHRKPEIADLLIDKGASLSVFEAAASGRLQELLSMLDSDPLLVNAYAADGFQPLGLASFFGHKPAADALIQRGAQVSSASRNPQRVQPLHSAVAGHHFEIARTLLAHGAEVNACQSGGFTPLHGAAQSGQLEMIQLLLEHGADVQVKSFDGKLPADLAVEQGHTQAADLLRNQGSPS